MLGVQNALHSAARVSVLLCAILLAPIVRSNPLPNSPHIAVVGEGSVSVKADTAVIQLAVSVRAKSAAAALQQLDERVDDFLSFLVKNIGLEKKCLQVADLQIYKSAQQQGKKDAPDLHNAIRAITVTVPNLDDVDRIIKGATKHKVDKVGRVELKISDETPHRLAARELAIKDAQEKVKLLAHGFNCKVGSIYSIYYQLDYESQIQPKVLAASVNQTDFTDYYRQQRVTFSDKIRVVFGLEK